MVHRSAYRQAWETIFQPQNVAVFLVATLAFNFATSAAYDLLRETLGPGRGRLGCILVVSAVTLVALVALLRRLAAPREQVSLQGHRAPTPRRGLVFLLGQEAALEQALAHHRGTLERVWLITSLRSTELAKALPARHPDLDWAAPVVLRDVYDPSEAFEAVQRLYAELPPGWTEADLVADFTGLTSQCSVGLVLACLGRDRALQYTPAILNDQGQPIGSSRPIEMSLDLAVGPAPADAS